MPQAAKHRSTPRSLSGVAVISSHPKARHHGQSAGRQRLGSHSGEKTWREVADRGLEVSIR